MCRFQLGVRRAPFQEFQAGGTQVGGAPGRQGGAAGVNQETHLLFLLDGTMTSRWALRPFPAVNQSQSNECRGRKSWRHTAVTRWKWCEMVRNCAKLLEMLQISTCGPSHRPAALPIKLFPNKRG